MYFYEVKSIFVYLFIFFSSAVTFAGSEFIGVWRSDPFVYVYYSENQYSNKEFTFELEGLNTLFSSSGAYGCYACYVKIPGMQKHIRAAHGLWLKPLEIEGIIFEFNGNSLKFKDIDDGVELTSDYSTTRIIRINNDCFDWEETNKNVDDIEKVETRRMHDFDVKNFPQKAPSKYLFNTSGR